MTRDEINSLSGEKLRIAVAKAVGWTEIHETVIDGYHVLVGIQHDSTATWAVPVDRYESDIGAAWELVNRLMADGWSFAIISAEESGWLITLARNRYSIGNVFGNTAPEAICRAFLLAKLEAK